jgi:hypothetical protein
MGVLMIKGGIIIAFVMIRGIIINVKSLDSRWKMG